MKKSIYILILVFVGMMVVTGCEYDFIYRPTPPPIEEPDPDDPVDPDATSFSTMIVPIFTTGNRCTSCHGDGGTRPYLTAAKAYSEIISKGLVNTANPASSKLYTYVKPGAGTHAWKQFTDSQSALVLKWITEGAKNN
ncbi:MAG: hypothetical protein KKG99_14720 [Bacteroidetes bacterium]|nr:hypothetical protein [Bacteroidota bacterium]